MVDDVFESDGDGPVILRLFVQPGAGRSDVVGRHGDALKVRVAAPPERGRANQACARLLVELFELEASAVTLVGGETSRSKRFALAGAEPAALRAQLARVLDAGATRAQADRPRAQRGPSRA